MFSALRCVAVRSMPLAIVGTLCAPAAAQAPVAGIAAAHSYVAVDPPRPQVDGHDGPGGDCGRAETLDQLLTNATQARKRDDRIAAILTLRRCDDARVVEVLSTAARRDPDDRVRMPALSALVLLMLHSVSPIATDALLHTAAHDKKRDIRIMAIGGLGLSDDPRAVEVLTASLQRDRDARIRAAAVAALGHRRDPAALELVMPALHDRNADVRRAAVNAIGRFDDPRVESALSAALRDPNKDVRAAAARVGLRVELARGTLALWDLHSSSLFEEVYIGSPLGIGGVMNLASGLTRAIGVGSQPRFVEQFDGIPVRTLFAEQFAGTVSPLLSRPFLRVEGPDDDVPVTTTRSFRLAKAQWDAILEATAERAVERARDVPGTDFVVQVSSLRIVRREHTVNPQTSVTTESWAFRVAARARVVRISDGTVVWQTAQDCRIPVEQRNPSVRAAEEAMNEAAACAIRKLTEAFTGLLTGTS